MIEKLVKHKDRLWEVWRDPEYAESRLRECGDPIKPPNEWNIHKYTRLRHLPKLIKGRSVLDVDCGNGP